MILREPPFAGSEAETWIGSLERSRRIFAWKTGGLDAAQRQVRIGSSSLTIGGLVKHVAFVEESVFTMRLHDEAPAEPWRSHDWDGDPNWVWRGEGDVYELYRASVARGRAQVSRAIAERGLEGPSPWAARNGAHPSTRRLIADMIEEYARHIGHADLIRESIDGLVGEDPPEEFPAP